MSKKIGEDFKFVVVGGGTAGWLTALYLRRTFSSSKITVVESSQIGILGAGEGSTPNILGFLEYVGVPLKKLFNQADATFKHSIKFTNWNNDNKYYYHGFYTSINDFDFTNLSIPSDYNTLVLEAISNGYSSGHLNTSNFLSENYLSPIAKFSDQDIRYVERHHGLHFNAKKLAEVLKTVSLEKNVHVIDRVINEFVCDDEGNIVQLICDDKVIESDFVFDCSGLSRLIIGGHFNSKWCSYEDVIPNDSALPFFIEDKNNLPPFTESIAMDNGWVWKIPTQERYGCGYVYSSKFTDESAVRKEIVDKFGTDVIFPRSTSFNFKAGCYEQTWINNCVAIGLSSGFIEPLEATSIMMQIQSLFAFGKNIRGVTVGCKKSKERYNEFCNTSNHEILEFILLHYLTKRDNSNYWKHFWNVDCNKFNFNYINIILNSNGVLPNFKELNTANNEVFNYYNYIEVASGLGLFHSKNNKEIFSSLMVGEFSNAHLQKISKMLDSFKFIENFINHGKSIDYLVSHD